MPSREVLVAIVLTLLLATVRLHHGAGAAHASVPPQALEPPAPLEMPGVAAAAASLMEQVREGFTLEAQTGMWQIDGMLVPLDPPAAP